jgi:hypothetical protein
MSIFIGEIVHQNFAFHVRPILLLVGHVIPLSCWAVLLTLDGHLGTI